MTEESMMSELLTYYRYLSEDVRGMICVMRPSGKELKTAINRFMKCVEDEDCKTEPMESVLVLSLISLYKMDQEIEKRSDEMRKMCVKTYLEASLQPSPEGS